MVQSSKFRDVEDALVDLILASPKDSMRNLLLNTGSTRDRFRLIDRESQYVRLQEQAQVFISWMYIGKPGHGNYSESALTYDWRRVLITMLVDIVRLEVMRDD